MKKTFKIALTGIKGQLGWELQRALAPLGTVIVSDYPEVDLSKVEDIQKWIRDVKPDIFVNPGAYTAVDKAEDDQENCYLVNAQAPAVIAEEMEKINGSFLHYSTDYVFSGQSHSPYAEDDPKGPLSIYGSSKLKGEEGALANSRATMIFRTSWVYSQRGKNFLLTMLKLLREKQELSVVSDQIGSPTWARLLAEATGHIIAQSKQHGDVREFICLKSGIYNMTCGSKTSWFGFARAIQEHLQSQGEGRLAILKETVSSQYPTRAQRPSFSVLDNSKLNGTFGLKLPDWDQALALCLGE